jgi:beta-galactosidase
MKRRIEVRGGKLLIDGRARYLLSGEIHYFRIAPSEWRARLNQARAAGLDAVSTYIPWRWHEIAPPSKGQPAIYDFGGSSDEGRNMPSRARQDVAIQQDGRRSKPSRARQDVAIQQDGRRSKPSRARQDVAIQRDGRRDLVRWIDEVKAAGLDLILRLGPVCNGEMRFEGLPDRIATDPAALEPQGGALHHTTAPRYLAKHFLDPSIAWLKALLPIVVRSEAARGGPVILVQLDNEIGMVHWISGLRLDPTAFARYFGTLRTLARKAGVTSPLIANIPQFYDFDTRGRGIFAPLTSSLFEQFESSGCQIMGGAYQPRRLDAENGHDIHLATEAVRSVQERSIAICAETQVGMLFDRPRLYPKDVDLLLNLASATNLRGLNLYMFAGGWNPPGLGAFGFRHDWQAPVGPEGEERGHLEPIARFARFKRKVEKFLAEGETVTPVDLAVPNLYYRGATNPYYADAHAWLFDGLARLLVLEGLPPRWVWLGKPANRLVRPRTLRSKTIFAFSLATMDAASQRQLAALVRAGRHVVLGPDLPVQDELGKPCLILSRALGITPPTQKARMGGGEPTSRFMGETVLNMRHAVPVEAADAEVLGRWGDAAVAVGRRVGRGRVTFIGLGLSDRQDAQKEAFRALLRRVDLQPDLVARSPSPDRPLILRKRLGTEELVLVANLHETDWSGTLAAPEIPPLREKIPGRSVRWYILRGKRLWRM